jgi:membrane-associated protein
MDVLISKDFITSGGYLLIFAMVFAETGLLMGVFLPGDTLLFTSGLLASVGYLNIAILILVCFLGTVLGDNVGYGLGRKYGHKVFKKTDSLFFDSNHIKRAEKFYKAHGGKTVIFGRFLPFIRTAAPILAGVAKMNYRTFVTYNLVGAILWAFSFCMLGYVSGKLIPNAENYVGPIITLVVAGSVLIAAVTILLHYLKKKKAV